MQAARELIEAIINPTGTPSAHNMSSDDPDSAWAALESSQTFMECPNLVHPPDWITELDWPATAEGAVRCVCISDTHGHHAHLDVPPGTILIHAGDFTMCGAEFEVEEFAVWFGALPHPYKIIIAGNHEADPSPSLDSLHLCDNHEADPHCHLTRCNDLCDLFRVIRYLWMLSALL